MESALCALIHPLFVFRCRMLAMVKSIAFTLPLLALLCGCSGPSFDIRLNYDKAIKECFQVSPEEIKVLICLKDGEKYVGDSQEGGYFLSFYHNEANVYTEGSTLQLKQDQYLVTKAELDTFAQDYEEDPLMGFAKRLQYKMGLDCEGTYKFVTTLLVDIDDLFRPCYCSDVTKQVRYVTDAEMRKKESPEHVEWFYNETTKRYFNDNPLPWTRLGYSYDYFYPSKAYGFTQFVAKEGSSVKVISTQKIDDYYAPYAAEKSAKH